MENIIQLSTRIENNSFLYAYFKYLLIAACVSCLELINYQQNAFYSIPNLILYFIILYSFYFFSTLDSQRASLPQKIKIVMFIAISEDFLYWIFGILFFHIKFNDWTYNWLHIHLYSLYLTGILICSIITYFQMIKEIYQVKL